MIILQTMAALREWRRAQSGGVILVPTMGALHEGHLALMRQARRLAGSDGSVIASIYVNPLQFGPREDFSRYPRELESDAAKCDAAGVDAIFAPDSTEMYAPDRSVVVLETKLSQGLCGASRPGHFDGVCTVVLKLFNLVAADTAVFGKKDYQQMAIIQRMVRDLDVPVAIVGCETVRETDGLALSSRNRFLNSEERRQAPAIRQALLLARERWLGGCDDAPALLKTVVDHLADAAPLHRLDYIACVDRETLEPLVHVDKNALLATAIFFGGTRLIDNIEL
ncbi:MAG TPA: pantoate--beta-alanine ligase [Verrucomicrobiaceae bacterium]|jgi:pantoate--beta-alanine ligase